MEKRDRGRVIHPAQRPGEGGGEDIHNVHVSRAPGTGVQAPCGHGPRGRCQPGMSFAFSS